MKARDDPEGELRAARLKVARGCAAWEEVEDDFVPRGYKGRMLVSAGSDRVFTLYPGVVWRTGSTQILADQAALSFVVRDGEPEFIQDVGRTWTQLVEARPERAAKR